MIKPRGLYSRKDYRNKKPEVIPMVSNKQSYVGLDVHKNFIFGCVKDKEGKTLFEQKFKNEPHSTDLFLLNVPRDSKVALESCSCWQYAFDYITDAGFDVVLSNPSRTRLIGESKKKTDPEDARKLANLLRVNMLPLSYAAPMHVRIQRQITRHRLSLVNLGVEIKNKIHAILLRHGIQTELDNIFTQKGLEYLESLDLPMCDRFEIDQYISLLRHLNISVDKTQERIDEFANDEPHAKLIQTHPGVGVYASLMIVAEIGDIRRFSSSKKLVSFAGLNPAVYQSGEKCYKGHISKQGSKKLRWILVQCANVAAQHDKRLKSFYMRKKLAKGHNKAIVAVARKMLVNLYVMMNHNIPFHALRVNKAT
jgi:transposase